MLTAEMLDAIGGLTAHVKAYAATLPSVVQLKTLSSGVKPSAEAIDNYEVIVSRTQRQSAGTPYKALNELVVSSLEAFEQGNLIGTVQTLLAVLDHLERMHAALESLRDTIGTAIQVNLSMATIEESETTKRLAAWAGIFAVATMFAGIWGMNFEFMPELKWRWGYPAALGVITAACVYVYWRFRRAGWL